MMNETFKSIRERRSIRKFTDEEVSDEKLEELLEAGRWAPSGKNNQPWRFKLDKDVEEKNRIASCTHYTEVVEDAKSLILVYLDKKSSYDRTKDMQSIGACCQNICLAAHSMGLGTVWNGEILNHRDCVAEIFDAPDPLELMALICIGYPEKTPSSDRYSLDKLMID